MLAQALAAGQLGDMAGCFTRKGRAWCHPRHRGPRMRLRGAGCHEPGRGPHAAVGWPLCAGPGLTFCSSLPQSFKKYLLSFCSKSINTCSSSEERRGSVCQPASPRGTTRAAEAWRARGRGAVGWWPGAVGCRVSGVGCGLCQAAARAQRGQRPTRTPAVAIARRDALPVVSPSSSPSPRRGQVLPQHKRLHTPARFPHGRLPSPRPQRPGPAQEPQHPGPDFVKGTDGSVRPFLLGPNCQ